ncbi:skin secretory protein xP2-like [Rissa tridactyla]|uniref:skin secretory protein xP2-like n=1 Tax=Rissa tridactyla TaxID=75485 RepID=UPI0023BA7569|nr:skin secretory protein xP2-like [Rissa tridactyla]
MCSPIIISFSFSPRKDSCPPERFQTETSGGPVPKGRAVAMGAPSPPSAPASVQGRPGSSATHRSLGQVRQSGRTWAMARSPARSELTEPHFPEGEINLVLNRERKQAASTAPAQSRDAMPTGSGPEAVPSVNRAGRSPNRPRDGPNPAEEEPPRPASPCREQPSLAKSEKGGE